MEISLSKLPWYAQIGAFVVVSVLAVFGFWKFYVAEMQADIDARQTRLTALRADIAKGVATARRLPQFQSDVAELERRLENLRAVLPEQKDVADILRRVQGLATQSSLTIQRFTPQEPKQEAMYASLPFKIRAEGTYHNLGLFFDRISKFPRIINVGEIVHQAEADRQDANASIEAECVATTFVLQESKAPAAGARRARHRAEAAVSEMSESPCMSLRSTRVVRRCDGDGDLPERRRRRAAAGSRRLRRRRTGDAAPAPSRRRRPQHVQQRRSPRKPARHSPTTRTAAAIRSSAWSGAATIRSRRVRVRRGSPGC